MLWKYVCYLFINKVSDAFHPMTLIQTLSIWFGQPTSNIQLYKRWCVYHKRNVVYIVLYIVLVCVYCSRCPVCIVPGFQCEFYITPQLRKIVVQGLLPFHPRKKWAYKYIPCLKMAHCSILWIYNMSILPENGSLRSFPGLYKRVTLLEKKPWQCGWLQWESKV